MPPIDLKAVEHFAAKHEEILGLLSLHFVLTMPAKLPWPFNKLAFMEWGYEWLHDGLHSFFTRAGGIVSRTESVTTPTSVSKSSSIEIPTVPVSEVPQNPLEKK